MADSSYQQADRLERAASSIRAVVIEARVTLEQADLDHLARPGWSTDVEELAAWMEEKAKEIRDGR